MSKVQVLHASAFSVVEMNVKRNGRRTEHVTASQRASTVRASHASSRHPREARPQPGLGPIHPESRRDAIERRHRAQLSLPSAQPSATSHSNGFRPAASAGEYCWDHTLIPILTASSMSSRSPASLLVSLSCPNAQSPPRSAPQTLSRPWYGSNVAHKIHSNHST